MKLLGFCENQVTPYAGVWIEILYLKDNAYTEYVTPYAGVWIEMTYYYLILKFITVTPYAGVWIEIGNKCLSVDII